MENGFKNEVVVKVVEPYTYQGITLNRVFYGQCACYENGKRLWVHKCGIQRISAGEAMKDAQQSAHDLAVTRFFNEQPA